MVFVNVILSMVDMMSVGSASSVGGKTMGLYLLTTLIASVLGLISILCFKSLFKQGSFPTDSKGTITLGCEEDSMLVHNFTTGDVYCAANFTEADDASMEFLINDVDGTFVKKSSGPASDLSMSDTIYDGVFVKLITSNIFDSFVDANFAAVVVSCRCIPCRSIDSLTRLTNIHLQLFTVLCNMCGGGCRTRHEEKGTATI